MNRRLFIQSATALFTLLTFGCGASAQTIGTFITAIGKDAAALATYFNASSIATQILTLTSQIATDVTNWQTGGAPVADAIQAINDLIGLINSIPVATPYAPLIILILSALTGLLALLPSSAAPAAVAKARAAAQQKYQVQPTHYPDATNKSMTKGYHDFNSAWAKQLALTPLK